ncbi:MAG TPA: M12 family metallo-peptidase [Tepidisphaeraceae bacterium]|nr:M12 family metallo-peptidase [Tepidisphaeraceae bacterium]
MSFKKRTKVWIESLEKRQLLSGTFLRAEIDFAVYDPVANVAYYGSGSAITGLSLDDLTTVVSEHHLSTNISSIDVSENGQTLYALTVDDVLWALETESGGQRILARPPAGADASAVVATDVGPLVYGRSANRAYALWAPSADGAEYEQIFTPTLYGAEAIVRSHDHSTLLLGQRDIYDVATGTAEPLVSEGYAWIHWLNGNGSAVSIGSNGLYDRSTGTTKPVGFNGVAGGFSADGSSIFYKVDDRFLVQNTSDDTLRYVIEPSGLLASSGLLSVGDVPNASILLTSNGTHLLSVWRTGLHLAPIVARPAFAPISQAAAYGPNSVTVRAVDPKGVLDPTFRGTASVTVERDRIAQPPITHTFSADDAGVWTFDVDFAAPGSYTLTVTCSELLTSESIEVPVVDTLRRPVITDVSSLARSSPGRGVQRIKLAASDDTDLAQGWLDTSHISVTAPDGTALVHRYEDLTFDHRNAKATIIIDAPGGFWDPSDNGRYTVKVGKGAVRDAAGQEAANEFTSTFLIDILPSDSYLLPQVSGYVYNAVAGPYGSEQMLVPNVRVYDDWNDNGQYDPFEPAAFTDELSKFSFRTGHHSRIIRVEHRPGWSTPPGKVHNGLGLNSDQYELYSSPANPVVIDLLVAADTMAAGIMRTKSDDGNEQWLTSLAQTINVAFLESQTNVVVRIVGVAQVNHTFSGDLSKEMRRLSNPRDRTFSAVHAERDRLGADIVLFLTSGKVRTPVLGLAYTYRDRPEQGLAAVVMGDEVEIIAAHEIGHLLGAGHEAKAERSPTSPYALGYRFTGVNGVSYMDLMSTNHLAPAERVVRFSNPDLTHAGVPLGDSFADNARMIRRTAPVVASYRGAAWPTPPAEHDLVATKFAAKLPDLFMGGERASASLSYVNNGDQLHRGPVNVTFYLSTNGTVDAGDTVVATVARNVSLKPGKGGKLTARFVLPSGLVEGNYTLLAKIDGGDAFADRNEANNVQSGPIATYAQPVLDLSVTPGTTTMRRGGRFAFGLTNLGNVPAKFHGTVDLTVWEVGPFDEVGVAGPIGTTAVSLKPSATRTYGVSTAFAKALAPGTYKFVLRVTPPDGVTDVDLTNNIATVMVTLV